MKKGSIISAFCLSFCLVVPLLGQISIGRRIMPIERGRLVTAVDGNQQSITNLKSVVIGSQIVTDVFLSSLATEENMLKVVGQLPSFSGVSNIVQAAIGRLPELRTNEWNAAHAWGNHAAAGYVHATATNALVAPLAARASTLEARTNDWNTAVAWGNMTAAWGNHALAGYLLPAATNNLISLQALSNAFAAFQPAGVPSRIALGEQIIDGSGGVWRVETKIDNSVSNWVVRAQLRGIDVGPLIVDAPLPLPERWHVFVHFGSSIFGETAGLMLRRNKGADSSSSVIELFAFNDFILLNYTWDHDFIHPDTGVTVKQWDPVFNGNNWVSLTREPGELRVTNLVDRVATTQDISNAFAAFQPAGVPSQIALGEQIIDGSGGVWRVTQAPVSNWVAEVTIEGQFASAVIPELPYPLPLNFSFVRALNLGTLSVTCLTDDIYYLYTSAVLETGPEQQYWLWGSPDLWQGFEWHDEVNMLQISLRYRQTSASVTTTNLVGRVVLDSELHPAIDATKNFHLQALSNALMQPFTPWTGVVTPVLGTATISIAHGNMPVLVATTPTVLQLNPAGFGTGGVSRIALSYFPTGTNTLAFATNIVRYAPLPTVFSNDWNSLMIRRVGSGVWRGAGL